MTVDRGLNVPARQALHAVAPATRCGREFEVELPLAVYEPEGHSEHSVIEASENHPAMHSLQCVAPVSFPTLSPLLAEVPEAVYEPGSHCSQASVG